MKDLRSTYDQFGGLAGQRGRFRWSSTAGVVAAGVRVSLLRVGAASLGAATGCRPRGWFRGVARLKCSSTASSGCVLCRARARTSAPARLSRRRRV